MTHTLNNIIDLTNAPTPLRWFEFLLEPGKLLEHLEANACDPSPTQLITLFYRNIPILDSNASLQPVNPKSIPQTTSTNTVTNGNNNGNNNSNSLQVAPTPQSNDADSTSPKNDTTVQESKLLIDYSDSVEVHIPPDSYEAKYRTKKAYALQTLALEVASFLGWDLDIICSKLSIPIQYKLMQALCNACSTSECPTDVKKFAEVLYCHWFLKSAITYRISTLQPQSNTTNIIYHTQLQQQQQAAESSAFASMGEFFTPDSKHLKTCSSGLHCYIQDLARNKDKSIKKFKGANHPFKKAKLSRPTIGCFDSRGEAFNDWTKVEPIDFKHFIDAACYDLGRFFFFKESYKLAKESFELIKDSDERFPLLKDYIGSAEAIFNHDQTKSNLETTQEPDPDLCLGTQMDLKRKKTEKYLFDCMTQFGANQKKKGTEPSGRARDQKCGEDSDLRIERSVEGITNDEDGSWYIEVPPHIHQQQLYEASRGDMFMSQGDYRQAMGCFVGTLMLMTDYFRVFSTNYAEEEPYITRMIQCSISLSCFTQAVALCQMTKNLNYTIAFKQLNERVCNDCCDDIYECIWNITLLEYIINLHSKRGEIERRAKVIQLIGQLELNENNPGEILKEAEHVRRGRFFRIMSNKYL